MGDVQANPVTWEHEYICHETGETLYIQVPAGESPPKSVPTSKGHLAYKNYGASNFVIPSYMRAGDELDSHDDAKRMMTKNRRRRIW